MRALGGICEISEDFFSPRSSVLAGRRNTMMLKMNLSLLQKGKGWNKPIYCKEGQAATLAWFCQTLQDYETLAFDPAGEKSLSVSDLCWRLGFHLVKGRALTGSWICEWNKGWTKLAASQSCLFFHLAKIRDPVAADWECLIFAHVSFLLFSFMAFWWAVRWAGFMQYEKMRTEPLASISRLMFSDAKNDACLSHRVSLAVDDNWTSVQDYSYSWQT